MTHTLIYIKNIRKQLRLNQFLRSFAIAFTVFVCGCKQQSDISHVTEEDLNAKRNMQGIWVDEEDGSVKFQAKGDTIFYADSISESVYFQIIADTLSLKSSNNTKYLIKTLTNNTLRFINTDGDEVRLTKSDDPSLKEYFERKEQSKVELNQGQLIKRDSVFTIDEKRFHAYIQVNPTSYKVFHQSVNDEGVTVDNAYFDNIIHVALYDGARALINRDFRKQDFAQHVPKEILGQCILSDITMGKSTSNAVIFTAILSIPDTYTSYNIIISVSKDGKIKMSV